MGSKTLCSGCVNRRLVDTSATTPPNTVLVVSNDGIAFCFAPENRVNSVTGRESLPIQCEKANPFGSCPWFVAATPQDASKQSVGILTIRGEEKWINPEQASGEAIPGMLGAKEIEANLAAEAASAPTPLSPLEALALKGR